MTDFNAVLDGLVSAMHTATEELAKSLREADARARQMEQKIASSQLEGKVILPSYEEFCNGAKGCMIGEFKIIGPEYDCPECGGEGFISDDEGEDRECMKCEGGKVRDEIPIPWTSIKEIYKRICEKYSREAN